DAEPQGPLLFGGRLSLVAVPLTTNWVRFVSTYFGVTNMNSVQASWEDEENNRSVELVVNYRLDAKRVEINEVTPTRVNFLCPTTGKTTRSIGVWTEG